jgi:microcystin-dependent protein
MVVYLAFPDNYTLTDPETAYDAATGEWISEIKLFAFSLLIDDHMECDGRLLPLPARAGEVNIYSQLFRLIGTRFDGEGMFGGDGVHSFRLPDLRSSAPAKDLDYDMRYAGAVPSWPCASPGPGAVQYCPVTWPQFFPPDRFVGEVMLVKSAGPVDSRWAVPCDGRKLPVAEARALFALIRNKYGGDGITDFAVPDLRAAQPPVEGAGYYIVVGGIFPPVV